MNKRLDITYGYDKNNKRITIDQLKEAIEEARQRGNDAPPAFQAVIFQPGYQLLSRVSYPTPAQAAQYAITTGKQTMYKTTDEWALIANDMLRNYQTVGRERENLVHACVARMKSWEHGDTDKEIARIALEALTK